ncbi:MAG: hypothetical protein B7Z67_04650 [Acidiphilium sp. 21-60-14]|nr:MAG: hypothetical protein B7Z67_04650 [Acidiphilium sp. 21-60-14]OZB40432.1 MAG: hypothetical protein B7X48_05025 [Acidiphilium sp. 34-60-192]
MCRRDGFCTVTEHGVPTKRRNAKLALQRDQAEICVADGPISRTSWPMAMPRIDGLVCIC